MRREEDCFKTAKSDCQSWVTNDSMCNCLLSGRKKTIFRKRILSLFKQCWMLKISSKCWQMLYTDKYSLQRRHTPYCYRRRCCDIIKKRRAGHDMGKQAQTQRLSISLPAPLTWQLLHHWVKKMQKMVWHLMNLLKGPSLKTRAVSRKCSKI